MEGIDEVEDLDDGSEEETEQVPCSWCAGEGIVYSQAEDDEEDKDFVQCKHCGGSGKDNGRGDEDDEDYSFLDED